MKRSVQQEWTRGGWRTLDFHTWRVTWTKVREENMIIYIQMFLATIRISGHADTSMMITLVNETFGILCTIFVLFVALKYLLVLLENNYQQFPFLDFLFLLSLFYFSTFCCALFFYVIVYLFLWGLTGLNKYYYQIWPK